MNNFIELFMRMPVFFVLFTLEKITPPLLALYYLAEAITYPVQTAYKRLICQVIFILLKSSAIPGMIPVRYSGIGHALKVIMFE